MKKLITRKILFLLTFLLSTPGFSENTMYQHARDDAKIKTCLETVRRISNFIIGDTEHGTHSFWSTKESDKTAISSAIELSFPDEPTLANIIVVPAANGKCYVEYQRIWVENSTCLEAEKIFKGTYKGELKQQIGYLDVNNSYNVYMIPTGVNQCVIIKKEVILDGNDLK